MTKSNLIVNRSGGPIDNDGPANLAPGVVIVHCVLEPDSGKIQIHRSERNPEPTDAQSYKVEMDNWFTTLTNCLALLIRKISDEMGVPRGVLIETANRVIQTYLETGGTGGHRKKIVVNSTDKEKDIVVQDKKEDEPVIKMDYDKEILEYGFSKLGEETYIEYCGRLGASERDKKRIPIASEFYNAIVFRKLVAENTDEKYFLEVAREKNLTPTPDDARISKYLVAMVIGSGSLERKFYWQISEPEKTSELLQKIESEAQKIVEVINDL